MSAQGTNLCTRCSKFLVYILIEIVIFIFVVFLNQVLAETFIWKNFSYPIKRYGQSDAIFIADNVVKTQRVCGGWGKLISPIVELEPAELTRDQLDAAVFDRFNATSYSHRSSTLDNGATHSHIRYLLRVAKATDNEKYKEAAIRGVNYLLEAQYSSGGWPQNFPNISSYGGHVTFNDGAMIGAMTALKEAASGEYSFIDLDTRRNASQAFLRGIGYILHAQIVVNGIKTAWGAQHDKDNFTPVGGRTYELPSISGAESVAIVKLLMGIEQPNEVIKQSIVSAVEWFENYKILGFEYVRVYDDKYKASFTVTSKEDPNAPSEIIRTFSGRGYDNILVSKTDARPIWARFYDLKTQKPFFVGWDGVKRYDISEIDIERRTGYMWYGYWPENLLKYDWPKWKNKYYLAPPQNLRISRQEIEQ